MKNILTFVLGLLFTLSSQSQTMTGFRLLHDSNAKDVSAYLIKSLTRDLETQIRNGNIIAFSDKEIKDTLSLEETLTNFHKPVAMQVINPNNPDDPYDLIDTIIYEPILPKDWFAIQFLSGSVLLNTHHSKSVYLSKKAIPLVPALERLAELAKITRNGRIDFWALPALLTQRIDSLQWKLYSLMFLEKRILYEDMTGRLKWEGENTRLFPCDQREVHQIVNPFNPDDPFDRIDTVIVTVASPDILDGIFFGDQLDAKYSISLQAISVFCSGTHFYYLNHRSDIFNNWYWVLWQDLSEQLDKDDRDLLLFLNAWCYLNLD